MAPEAGHAVWRAWFALAFLCAALLTVALPQRASAQESATRAPSASDVRAEGDAWRAALPRDPAAATQAYLDRIEPEAGARSDAYFEGGQWLQLWNLLLGLAIAWVLLQARWAQALRRRCTAWTTRPFLQALSYGALYVAAGWLLGLPLTVYQGFVREHQYGMATQTLAAWFGEQLIGLALSVVLGALLIAAVYAVIRRAPQRWWIGGAAVVMAFTVVGVALAPVYIEPLFNTYKPLADTPLKRKIVAMAQANGVPVANVYEFDASRQTTRVSANVSGLFGTAAVRLNDNLLRRSSEPEILAVVGHEIGHYAMNHIPKSLLQIGLVILVGFGFTAAAVKGLLARFGARWGVGAVQEPGSLPLLAAVLSVYLYFATPLLNTMTRTMELEADLYGLNLAREPDGEAEVLLKLVQYRKADPGALEEALFFTHPGTRRRIENAMRWKAQMLPAP